MKEEILIELGSLFNEPVLKEYEELAEAWRKASWLDKDWYKAFLANHYYIVAHTERLICLAAAKTDIVFLRRGMIAHFHDEEEHEEMLLSDLKNLGGRLSDYPEQAIARTIYQTLYHDIEYSAPEAITGRICALELMATDVIPGIYGKLAEAHGEDSCTFLKTHADEDIDHVQKAISGLKKIIDINPELSTPILKQFKQTCFLYSIYLRDIRP